MNTNLIEKAFSSENFCTEAEKLIHRIADCLEESKKVEHSSTISRLSPEEELAFWEKDFQTPSDENLDDFWEKLFSHSINFHSRGYMGHQVSSTPIITALTGAAMSFLNNSTTVYEIGMAGNAMEKVVLNHLIEKYGYQQGSTGIVTSGGSLGNLTALVTARTSSGFPETDYGKLAILVSEQAHYSIERAASIMGIPHDNIIKIPAASNHCMITDCLEEAYQECSNSGKIVFCVVGCAGTTATGAYDNLNEIADFAERHNIWFHVDGAHGACVIFSKKYKYLLNGIERSDSLIVDFHKMLMAPAISTALLYNAKNHTLNEFSPSAAYLWQNQLSEEWYNSAKHTLECTKPITILHTYAIMKQYGDELYQQHIDYLYDLGHTFADMVLRRSDLELALYPSSNIVCFRYCSNTHSNDELNKINKQILKQITNDGTFYIVSTTINDTFYLRVSLMNPLTTQKDILWLLDEIEETGTGLF